MPDWAADPLTEVEYYQQHCPYMCIPWLVKAKWHFTTWPSLSVNSYNYKTRDYPTQ